MELILAAQYLRRSTEHQQYSLQNQEAKIREYAEQNGYKIIRTYSDGKSGLALKRRSGLQALLQEVISGIAPYRAILVYDVSRWGRFQDTDESAHYEFLCRSTGIPVHYCAEEFTNDGSMPSGVMKALKRSMAGAYSRDLSIRVSQGLRRLALLGFKQGSQPGLGYRRMLLSSDGKPKRILKFGEHKSITTERVVLVPGPKKEVELVRKIFRLFVDKKFTVPQIVRELNAQGLKEPNGSCWTYGAIKGLLGNLKYTGCQVFGRTTQKLSTPIVHLPREQWTVKPGAFQGIIDQETFDKAQARFRSYTVNKSNEELLDGLRRLLARKGRLSVSIIQQSRTVPSPAVYHHRFGRLGKAYELIGYDAPENFKLPRDLKRRTNAVREQVLHRLESLYPGYVTVVGRHSRTKPYLQLPGFTVTIQIARATKTRSLGKPKWLVDPGKMQRERTSICLLVRLVHTNDNIFDCYLLPKLGAVGRFALREEAPKLQKATRLDSLEQFYDAVTCMRSAKDVMSRSAPDSFL